MLGAGLGDFVQRAHLNAANGHILLEATFADFDPRAWRTHAIDLQTASAHIVHDDASAAG